MIFDKIIPSQILQPCVKELWYLEFEKKDLPFTQLWIPYNWFEFYCIFEINENKTDRTFTNSTFAGQFSSAFTVSYNKPIQVVGANLQPWAGNLIHGIPANEFSNSYIGINDLEPNSSIIPKMEGAKTKAEILANFEQYLLEKLERFIVDDMAAYIAKSIIKNGTHSGELSKVLKNINYGRRRIEQRFLAATGVSMGTFIKNRRFEKAMQLLSTEKLESLTQTGLSLGYYDQAHFTRSFKKRANLNPKTFRKNLMTMDTDKRKLLVS